jgi:hypothetical protein
VSTPGQQAPFLDAANLLLASGPARIETGTIDIPGTGRVGALTIRTASTTLTVFLTAVQLDEWALMVSNLAAAVRAAVLVQPTAAETALLRQGNGRRPPGSPDRPACA